MRRKYDGRMIARRGDYYPHAKDANTNDISWFIIDHMYKLRCDEPIPFEELVIATKGHVHGDAGHHGKDSSGFITYLCRSGVLEVL